MSRTRGFWITVLSLPLLACAVLAGISYWSFQPVPLTKPPQTVKGENLEATGRAVLATYCVSCHVAGRSGADFDETTLQLSAMRRDPGTWELVIKKLRSHKMPPRAFPQPSDDDREDLIRWIEEAVLDQGPDSTGPLMARRLLRSEYQNAIHELFGAAIETPVDLPDDDRGWDRRANVPTLAEPMLAMYREAAARVLEDALASELTSLTPGCEPEDMDSAVTEATPYLFIRNSQTKTEAEHARAVLASFAQRAFRRPVDASETDQLVATFVRAVNERGSYEEGMHAALMEILTSSHFLFRMEARADAAVEQTSRSSSESHARASRLSFFLWASAPDQELLRQADKGLNEESSSTQARRLLKDPRSQAFAHDFANHWLGLDRLKPSRPAEKNLVRAMRQETEHFFAAMVAEDRSVLEFLDADYTYLNEALANHYGIPGVQGEQLRRVALPEGQRGGLLTQGSLLTILSPHQESSPVLRGKWVLENLLGSAPIRPPASVVEAFQSAPRSLGQMPMRQLLEKHRTDPSCAACHARMDAIGLSLENFGPTGAWRTDVAGQAVDSNSDLPDGAVLNGPGGLKTYLLAHRREFVRALSERLLAYSLGRKLTDQDRASLEHVADRVAADDYRFSSVILQVVQSEPFQQGWRGVAVR